MTLEIFISILVLSATATSLATEIIKIWLKELGIEYKTMPVAVVIAFVIGAAEMVIYSLQNGLNGYVVIYAICTGIANIIGSTTSYDTAKALICALAGNEPTN